MYMVVDRKFLNSITVNEQESGRRQMQKIDLQACVQQGTPGLSDLVSRISPGATRFQDI